MSNSLSSNSCELSYTINGSKTGANQKFKSSSRSTGNYFSQLVVSIVECFELLQLKKELREQKLIVDNNSKRIFEHNEDIDKIKISIGLEEWEKGNLSRKIYQNNSAKICAERIIVFTEKTKPLEKLHPAKKFVDDANARRISSNKNDIEIFNKSIAACEAKIKKLLENIEELQTRLQTIEEDNIALKNSTEDATKQIEGLTLEIEACEKDINILSKIFFNFIDTIDSLFSTTPDHSSEEVATGNDLVEDCSINTASADSEASDESTDDCYTDTLGDSSSME